MKILRLYFTNTAWIEASASKYIRTAFFWDITLRVVVIPHRRFGTTYRSIFQCSRVFALKMRPICRPETSARNHQYTVLPAPGESSSHSRLIIILPYSFGDTNKYTILPSIYIFYLTSTSFGIVAIFNDLTPKFHLKTNNNKYEPLLLYTTKIYYKPIKNIAYNLEDWMQFESRMVICLHSRTVTENFIFFMFMVPCVLVIPVIQVSQKEWTKLRKIFLYAKVHRHNPKHLYRKLNGYGDNGQRSLKVWQLLHTYWLPNSY